MPAKINGLEGLSIELARIEDHLGKATLRGLRVAAEELRNEVIKQMGEVKPYSPVDTGALRRGWEVVHHTDGAVVQNLVPYAGHMEFGTKPHWAPIQPLRLWAARKLRGKASQVKGFVGPKRRTTSKGKAREQAIERLARGTQAAIAKRGLKGRFFWRATLSNLDTLVERAIERELWRVR